MKVRGRKCVVLFCLSRCSLPLRRWASAQPVQVDKAWARATAAGAMSGGIFLTVTDTGAPDRLVGASTPAAATAELHETVNDNGVMRMRPVAGLPLETGGTVVLKPGSYHVMLMGAAAAIEARG